jgi:CysZ protein
MFGANELLQGFKWVVQPGLKRYVMIPLLINLSFMGGFMVWSFSYLSGWMNSFLGYIPDWLAWLSWVLTPIIVLTLLAMLVYVFNMVANIVAAPFNSLLAEQIEKRIRPDSVENTETILQMTLRTLVREFSKLAYYLPRLLVLVVISFIPLVNIASPFLWFIFGAWMMSVQYADYVADNNQQDFTKLRASLRQRPVNSIGFGAIVSLSLMIPVLNFIMIPVAVAGATVLWLNIEKKQA